MLMIFDDLSPAMQIVLAIVVPPILTLVCWLASRRLAPGQPAPSRVGLSSMLLAAYILFGIALYSSRYFAGTARGRDPDTMVLQ